MARFVKPSTVKAAKPANQGLSLIEIAVTMAVVAVVSLGSTHALSMFSEVQKSQRLHNVQQVVAMNVVDNLRQDLRFATRPTPLTNAFTITGGNGNVLTIPNAFEPTLGSYSVTYTFTGTTVTRAVTVGGVTTTTSYTADITPGVTISCGAAGGACFQVASVDVNGNPRGVRLNQMQVTEAAQDTDAITTNFGPARFAVANVTFDMLGNILFY
jgi:prepilin-type N-terminal cleavage/methylation domain-containing protein